MPVGEILIWIRVRIWRIRDRAPLGALCEAECQHALGPYSALVRVHAVSAGSAWGEGAEDRAEHTICLLYTSDAADVYSV